MAKSAAERQREYRARRRAEFGNKVMKGIESAHESDGGLEVFSSLRQLRHDMDALSGLYDLIEAIDRRVAKLEDLAERRR